jgi:preprotein translocase subunit SecY
VVLLKSFANIFRVSELKKRLMFTLGVLIIFRIGHIVPIVGINIALLAETIKEAVGLGYFFNFLDTVSGSAFGKCTVFALGIQPYITASIAMQILTMGIPSLEQLQKEGEYGRQIINQYTRYLTLGLAVLTSLGYVTLLEMQGLVLNPGIAFKFMFVISMTAGAMFVMWMGEQISLFGVGNGASMLIFAGIVARMPDLINRTIQYVQIGTTDLIAVALVAAFFVVLVGCIVFLEKGERKIPVQYARRVIGNRVYGGQSSYIPFKINPVGVMPVIFAGAALQYLLLFVKFISMRFESLSFLRDIIITNLSFILSLQFLLIVFFTFLYTAMVFNPDELSENIKKNGGFIPGIRPGKKTAAFFDFILNRIGLVGAIYLGILATVPEVVQRIFDVPFLQSGISILIAVGVSLEASAQIESYLIEHRYEGFLSSGRVKSRMLR